jgi:hypothetical protein
MNDKSQGLRKRSIAGAALVALALGLTACGGTLTAQSKPPVNHVQGNTTAPPVVVTTTTTPPALHVGQHADFTDASGMGLQVTMAQVIDPASGADQYEAPTSGDRFVAVQVRLKNTGTTSYSADVNSQVSLIGSDSQQYSPSFEQIKSCTNFNFGNYTLSPGDSLTGCVAFQVPRRVTIPSVKFIPSPGSTGIGTWGNP